MSELIEKYYSEAVSELKEEWFSNTDSKWYEHIINLPIHLQIVYMVVVLDNQVFNGGFHQYFTNRYGQFSRKTVEHLKLIGADEKAGILIEAYSVVNYKEYDDLDFRKALLEGRIKKLFVEDEFFEVLDVVDQKYDNSNEDIEELLNLYLEGIS